MNNPLKPTFAGADPSAKQQKFQEIAMSSFTLEELEIYLCIAFQLGDNQAKVQSWLDELPPRDAQLLKLRAQGLPWKTISVQIHADASTAWRRWKRAINQLYQLLNKT